MGGRTVRAIGLALTLVCFVSPVWAATLWGVQSFTEFPNVNDAILVKIDTNTQTTSVMKLTGKNSVVLPTGVSGTRGGRLLSINFDDQSYTSSITRIDTKTGAMKNLRRLKATDDIFVGNLQGLAAVGSGKKSLISTYGDNLVHINAQTGRTQLGPQVRGIIGGAEHDSPINLTDISFAGGRLYGVGEGSWFEINRTTGRATDLGSYLIHAPQTIAATNEGLLGTTTAGVLERYGQGSALRLFPTTALDYLTTRRPEAPRSQPVASPAPAPVPLPAAGAMLFFAISGMAGAGWWRRERHRELRLQDRCGG